MSCSTPVPVQGKIDTVPVMIFITYIIAHSHLIVNKSTTSELKKEQRECDLLFSTILEYTCTSSRAYFLLWICTVLLHMMRTNQSSSSRREANPNSDLHNGSCTEASCSGLSHTQGTSGISTKRHSIVSFPQCHNPKASTVASPNNKEQLPATSNLARMESSLSAPCSPPNTQGTGRMLAQPANSLSLIDIVSSLVDIDDSIHPPSLVAPYSYAEYYGLSQSNSTRSWSQSGLQDILDQAIRMIDEDDLAQQDGAGSRQMTRASHSCDASFPRQ